MLTDITHVFLDMDGTIYAGDELFAFTPVVLERLTTLGIGYTFLTNNCTRGREEYVAHLRELGLHVHLDQIHTSAEATVACLAQRWPAIEHICVLGTPNLVARLRAAGYVATDAVDGLVGDEISEPDLVVTSFDTTLTYERLCRAAYWIKCGKPWVATHLDAYCPTNRETVLVDSGSICAALTHATGRSPDAVAGKPHATMLAGLLDGLGLSPDRVAVVGDRLSTDIAMAANAGCHGILVLSGDTRRDQIDGAEVAPDIVLENLSGLPAALRPGAW